ncbi:hypothetical protein ACIPL1_27755 [Pseudomonas sp. NPDC090202]|uniref:hypothetical protein n=1 Tax=unclassified Pseudomonas TaxID=196821 RepID=UPI0038035ECF
MRIVNLPTFLSMAEGTVFSKYEPQNFREPMVKAESLGDIDFRYTSLTDEVDCLDSDERMSILFAAEEAGTSFALHFNTLCRDGEFDPDQLFVVWAREDVEGLIVRLQQALADGYGVEKTHD